MKILLKNWLSLFLFVASGVFAFETYSLVLRTNLVDIQIIFLVFTILFGYTAIKVWKQETKGKNNQ